MIPVNNSHVSTGLSLRIVFKIQKIKLDTDGVLQNVVPVNCVLREVKIKVPQKCAIAT